MIIALIALLPLILGIIVVAVYKDVPKLRYIAIGASALGLILSLLASYGSFVFPWFSVAGYTLNISILVAPLNFMLLLLVMLIGTLVMVYSSGYMSVPSEQRRFYIELLSFEAAMATFSISGNFITLFIAWGFLSLTSYLLIGFWTYKDSANRAARKAITIILIGDLAMLGAIILFWNAFGTLEFTSIISALATNTSPDVYLGVLLLLVAIFTKSAQFPFHEWLIDAMEGPTPVSSYLHSSTMVKAGVFVAILLFPLFSATGTLPIILIFGIVTAIIATFCALREMHIKKVIAYSTIQELSIMLIALGSGAILAAIYFFFVQTFYKALLFFSAGNIIEASDTNYLDESSGLKSNRLIYLTTLVGVLSLAGFIPFSGFFANEGISNALSTNIAVYAIISAISLLTSFYIFRWFFYPSRKTSRAGLANNYRTQPATMVYPMVVLAVLTLFASAFFLYLPSFIGYGNYLPFLSGLNISLSINESIIFLVLIAIGALLSYLTYVKGMIKVNVAKLGAILYTNPVANLAYNMVASFFYEIGDAANMLDTYTSDAFDSIGRLTMNAGLTVRRASVGDINLYALVFIAGVIVLFAIFYVLVIA